MEFAEYVESGGLLLTEGSVYEKLRRSPLVSPDPHIANASLIYDPQARSVLRSVVEEYLAIGQRFELPMMCLTNTWRANPERISSSKYSDQSVNTDCLEYYHEIVDELARNAPIYLGGLIGCRGDAYKANEALSEDAAYAFHKQQITELVSGEVDFLYGATLPATSEAKGIARAMSETGVPYILSFILRPDGTLLDGSTLTDAVREIDAAVRNPPIRFMIGCTHSSVFRAAHPAFSEIAHRIGGLEANTSAVDPLELDGSEELLTEDPHTFGHEMRRLRDDFNIQVLGGCCGTDTAHIEELAKELAR